MQFLCKSHSGDSAASGNATLTVLIIDIIVLPLNKQPPTLVRVAGHFWDSFSPVSPKARPLSVPRCSPPPLDFTLRPRIRATGGRSSAWPVQLESRLLRFDVHDVITVGDVATLFLLPLLSLLQTVHIRFALL